MTSISSAKLRTRTGCLQCRNRRKKCDELRPQCAGCRRNQLQCIWPSNEERKDGRIRQPRSTQSISFDQHVDGLSGVGTKSTSLAGPTLRPPVQMPSPFQLEEHCYLYRYFGSDILPRLVRRNSLARYADQSYKLRLALEFPPLMGALISTSAMQLACVSGKSIHFALKTYTQTINGLRQALDRKIDFVSHDALLATVITLSVFESFRPDCKLNVSPHVRASAFLLQKRHARWKSCPQARAVFDRICVESFVYHASVMMVFDPSLDSLSQPSLRMQLLSYFSDPVHSQGFGADSQPILHVSYQWFFLIADATKLARLARSLDDAEIQTWKELNGITQSCHTIENPQDTSAQACELYNQVFRILLLKSDPDLRSEDLDRQMGRCVAQGTEVLPLIDKTEFFTSALVWLLAILGSVAVLPDEQLSVRDFLSIIIASSLGGQPAWVLKRLENIWSISTETPSFRNSHLLRVRGLQALLDG